MQTAISCNRSATRIIFSGREGLLKHDGSESYRVGIESEGLEAALAIYAFNPFGPTLAQFFRELANSWRGWNGGKKWTSLEGELSLVCLHDGVGHISVDLMLRKLGEWTAETVIEITAGDIENVANNISEFFSIEKPNVAY